MGPPDRRRPSATYADLLTVPDHLVAEILDGELELDLTLRWAD